MPTFIFIGDGDLTIERAEWVQPFDRWTAIYYHHPNTLVVFAPGVRATHARLREGTYHHFITFNLPAAKGTIAAIPSVVHPASDYLASLNRAAQRIADDRRPAVAWAWNFVWSIAQNPAVSRSRAELYAAEEWIFRHLGRRFAVAELCEAVGLSQRHLLRAFRQEHRMSIQEFVRSKRVMEAARLLTTTELPVKEIAVRVGIADLQAFNKAIRTETGVSPRAFRATQG